MFFFLGSPGRLKFPTKKKKPPGTPQKHLPEAVQCQCQIIVCQQMSMTLKNIRVKDPNTMISNCGNIKRPW